MKNLLKVTGIITIFAVIGLSLAACGDPGDNAGGGGEGLPPAGDGSFNSTAGNQNWDVYDLSGNKLNSTVTFTRIFRGVIGSSSDPDDFYAPFSDLLDETTEVKMTGGKLSVKLGTPKTDKLQGSDEYQAMGMSFSPSDLKIYAIFMFFIVDNNSIGSLSWGSTGTGRLVQFMFADRDGTISGTYSEEGFLNKYNLKLKKGWNTVICTADYSTYTATYVTGTPGSDLKWYYNAHYVGFYGIR